jgi:nucleolar protein 9
MPRPKQQRGHRHAEKRKAERGEEERKYLASQERDSLFYSRPKNPFGLLTREDERFFSEVSSEFKKNEWLDDDAKEAFMNNVFLEMRGKELKIVTSHVGQFLEMLLAQCPKKELARIIMVFRGHMKELARHRLGSFALEKVAGYSGIWISRDIEKSGVKEEGDGEQIESLEILFGEIVEVNSCFLILIQELLYPEMHELFVDPFASHVYQAFLHTLNGHPQMNLDDQHKKNQRKKKYETPSSFTELKMELVNMVKQWDIILLQALVFDKYSVSLLQTILEIDIPKKKSKKNAIANRTLTDILLFGNDKESKGQLRRT